MHDQPTRSVIVPHDTPLPPPPPGVRHVRVRWLGIVIADDALRYRVRRRFHWPMIVLALLVLPLIAIDIFFLAKHPELKGSLLWWCTVVAMGVIWLAFLVEFVIKVAIAECRIEYVKRNWLDVVIILMPALRPLRVATLAKTTRVFTLRGVGMKFARYVFTIVVGLEATERMLARFGVERQPGRRDPERMTRLQLVHEVRDLRRRADRWDAWHRDHRAWLEAQGLDPALADGPEPDAADGAGPDAPTTIPPSCESPSPN